jgi:hypothetical protein
MKEIKFDNKLENGNTLRVNYTINEIIVLREYVDEMTGANLKEYGRVAIEACKYIEFNSIISDEKVIQSIKILYDYTDWND